MRLMFLTNSDDCDSIIIIHVAPNALPIHHPDHSPVNLSVAADLKLFYIFVFGSPELVENDPKLLKRVLKFPTMMAILYRFARLSWRF